MMPNLHIHEQFVHERIQERHREADQARMLARLPRSRSSVAGSLIGCLGTFFVVLGTGLQQLEQRKQPIIDAGRRDGTPCMKRHEMNPPIPAEEPLPRTLQGETSATEAEVLAQCSFTPDEIVALLWLRQWYQTSGSDRAQFVRHLEFLKLLVMTGELEV